MVGGKRTAKRRCPSRRIPTESEDEDVYESTDAETGIMDNDEFLADVARELISCSGVDVGAVNRGYYGTRKGTVVVADVIRDSLIEVQEQHKSLEGERPVKVRAATSRASAPHSSAELGAHQAGAKKERASVE